MTKRARGGPGRAGTPALAGLLARVLTGGLALALAAPGCGHATPTVPTSPAARPEAPHAAPGSPPGGTCPARVASAALSAIRFFTATSAVGMWPGGGWCGARLAVTADGGRAWRLTGSALPGPVGAFSYQPAMAFPSPRLGWADGAGVLDITRDGGTSWARVRLGGPVQAISMSGTSLWAFVARCPARAANPARCRYRVETTALPGAAWHLAGLLPATLGGYTPLIVARFAARRALVALGQMSRWPAYLTTDGGATWVPVRACAPAGYSPVALAATSPRLAWALCLGGTAAGSSTKSLARSADAGQRWTLIAEDRNLNPGTPRPVPTDPGDVLAAPSPSVLWFAGVNALWGSTNGGRAWSRAAAVSADGAGATAAFSFTSPGHGWLLIPTIGLWQTTDGRHWRQVRAITPAKKTQT